MGGYVHQKVLPLRTLNNSITGDTKRTMLDTVCSISWFVLP
jgi:hypothetical protein